MECEYCSAPSVLVGTWRDGDDLACFLFECDTCNTAWKNTEPGVVERLVAARMAAVTDQ
jgi:hypothetical protein